MQCRAPRTRLELGIAQRAAATDMAHARASPTAYPNMRVPRVALNKGDVIDGNKAAAELAKLLAGQHQPLRASVLRCACRVSLGEGGDVGCCQPHLSSTSRTIRHLPPARRQVWDLARHLQRPAGGAAQFLAWQLSLRHLQLQQLQAGEQLELREGEAAWLLQGEPTELAAARCVRSARRPASDPGSRSIAAGTLFEQAGGAAGGGASPLPCCSLLNPAALEQQGEQGDVQGWQEQRRLVAATAAAVATLDLRHYRAALQQCRRMGPQVLAAKHTLCLPRAQRGEGALQQAAAQLSALELGAGGLAPGKGMPELLELCAELQYLACPPGRPLPSCLLARCGSAAAACGWARLPAAYVASARSTLLPCPALPQVAWCLTRGSAWSCASRCSQAGWRCAGGLPGPRRQQPQLAGTWAACWPSWARAAWWAAPPRRSGAAAPRCASATASCWRCRG
jgi:hypothetical protein